MEEFRSEWEAEGFIYVPENTLLLNVETTGLRSSSSFVCMISAAYRNNHDITSITWLAGSRMDEKAMLLRLQDLADSFPALLTYGGNSFAFRFLADRFDIYSEAVLFPDKQLTDLQKSFRPLLHILPLTHMKKAEIESFLSFSRRGIRTGRELIPVFETWERQKDLSARDALIQHAQEDIHFLCQVCKLHSYLDFLHGKWESAGCSETAEGLLFSVSLSAPVPQPVSWQNDFAGFHLAGKNGQALVVPYHGSLRYFLPGPCSDYYYLPEEDTAIHRSVAQFVDRSRRVKATPDTCYVNREGTFLPVPASFPGPLFSAARKSALSYTEYDKEKWQQDTSLAGKYLTAIVSD